MKKYFSSVGKRIWADIKTYGIFPLGYLVWHFLAIRIWGASCPMLLTTGFPCPGCGMTRAVLCVFLGKWENAFYLNPVSFGLALFLILFVIFRYLCGKDPVFLKVFFWILIGLVFVRYIYGMLFFFPDRIPYVYRSANLFRFLMKHSL